MSSKMLNLVLILTIIHWPLVQCSDGPSLELAVVSEQNFWPWAKQKVLDEGKNGEDEKENEKIIGEFMDEFMDQL